MTEEARQIAARCKLRLIECERGLGSLRPEACAARWLVASGRAPGPAAVRESCCNGCPHGKRRHAGLSGSKRRQMAQRLGDVPSDSKTARKGAPPPRLRPREKGPAKPAHPPRPDGYGPRPREPREATWCRRCGDRLAIGVGCTRCAPLEAAERLQHRVG